MLVELEKDLFGEASLKVQRAGRKRGGGGGGGSRGRGGGRGGKGRRGH
jgi:hypothetical protein